MDLGKELLLEADRHTGEGQLPGVGANPTFPKPQGPG